MAHMRQQMHIHLTGCKQLQAPSARLPCKPASHARPRVVCRAWDSEETAARWQELPEVKQQHSTQGCTQQDPSHTLQRVLDVVRTGNPDGMLEFCSDEVIDKLLALKQQTG